MANDDRYDQPEIAAEKVKEIRSRLKETIVPKKITTMQKHKPGTVSPAVRAKLMGEVEAMPEDTRRQKRQKHQAHLNMEVSIRAYEKIMAKRHHVPPTKLAVAVRKEVRATAKEAANGQ